MLLSNLTNHCIHCTSHLQSRTKRQQKLATNLGW